MTTYGNGLTMPVTSTDVERAVRRRAVRAVCAYAESGDDAERLLEVLGLRPHEGRSTDDPLPNDR